MSEKMPQAAPAPQADQKTYDDTTGARSERPQFSERPDRADRAERADRPNRPDQADRPPFRERGERNERGGPRGGGSPMNKILALDRDILQLVARRARLLKAAYAPRPERGPDRNPDRNPDRAPDTADTPQISAEAASPARPPKRGVAHGSRASERTRVEKTLREAWQAEAAKISPDQRLNRELFALLQDISVPDRPVERPRQEGFLLTPNRQPVKISLPAFVSRRESVLHCALATACNAELRIENAPLGDHLVDTVKALNQIGGHIAWEADNTLTAAGGALNTTDAVVFLGNDPLGLWLTVFLAAPVMSKIKFMGGPDLKQLDVSPLRSFLPQLNARLAPVVPGSKGLPVRLECAGMLPDSLTVPENLPEEALAALLVAAAAWNRHTAIDCSAHPGAAACTASVLPLVQLWGANVTEKSGLLRFAPAQLRAPHPLTPHMDPLLSGFFLALPAVADGVCALSGNWGAALHETHGWADMLRAAGLILSRPDKNAAEGISSRRAKEASSLPLQAISAEALPVALALAARRAVSGAPCAVLPPAGLDAGQLDLVEEFLELLGCTATRPELSRPDMDTTADAPFIVSKAEEASPPRAWTAPNAAWALGLALGAFVRPGLLLANPGCMGDLLPMFWNIYNTLPEARLPRPAAPAPTQAEAPKRRRRIVAQSPLIPDEPEEETQPEQRELWDY